MALGPDGNLYFLGLAPGSNIFSVYVLLNVASYFAADDTNPQEYDEVINLIPLVDNAFNLIIFGNLAGGFTVGGTAAVPIVYMSVTDGSLATITVTIRDLGNQVLLSSVAGTVAGYFTSGPLNIVTAYP